MVTYYKTKIAVSTATARQINLQTMQHSKDDSAACAWHEYRRLHITSSNVGMIAKRRPTTKATSCVKNLLHSKFHGNHATAWGISQEEATANENIQWKANNGSPGVVVNTECGLMKSSAHPWLAATPDGFVTDPHSDPSEGLVEFKNPHSCKATKLIDIIKTKNTCLSIINGKLSLKRTHNYFYQIQTAMLCTETKWCDFVVRTTVDLHVERIFFDDSFCNSFLQKVRYFYFDCILPQLTDPRETIREPTEWIENLTDWHNTVDILTSPSPSALHHDQDADEIQLTP